MLKILNRDYVQTIDEIHDEFPNCHYLIDATDILGNCGKLIAVSEEPETDDQLCALGAQLADSIHVWFAGYYGCGGALGVFEFGEELPFVCPI